VDEEDMSVHCDADGIHWIQTSGTGVARDLRMERLEQMLSGVNDLYSESMAAMLILSMMQMALLGR